MLAASEESCAIVVSGVGAVSALGLDAEALWNAVRAGRCGIAPVTRYATDEFTSRLGAMVPDGAFSDPRTVTFAVAAAREALGAAFLDPRAEKLRVGLVLGTSLATRRADLSLIGAAVAAELALNGPTIVVSTACSSSTHAIGLARDLVLHGHCDVVLAGGSDELSPEIFAGFSALGVLSTERCAPFSEPVGTSLGEGAGLFVVERESTARSRGAVGLAVIRGWALSADAYHATSPDPAGAGVARAIRGALADAQLAPDEIDYVNAHGTGTAANDPAEARAIRSIFGEDAGAKGRPWVSSSKSFLGHAQGAAGALELAVTILGMRDGALPHTRHFTKPRPRCFEDPVAGERPRPQTFSKAISTSCAFAGANACIAVAAPSEPRPSVRAPRRVYVSAASLVGPNGATLADVASSRAVMCGRAPVDVAKVLRGVDPRGLDTTTALLIAATRAAIAAARLTVRAETRDRIGLFVGQTHVSAAADEEFHRSIEERSLAKLSSTAFAKMVLNAAAGAVTRTCDIRGATTAVSTGASSGTAAVALAADYLARHPELTTLVAAGVHELGAQDDPSVAAEGAAALILTTSPPDGPAVRLASWTFHADDAEKEALDAAALAPSSGGFGGAAAAALAFHHVSRGASRVLVRDARGTCPVTLTFEQTP